MSATLSFPAVSLHALPMMAWSQVRRIGPLGLIILLHIALFFAVQNNFSHKAVPAAPKEVFATFITPAPIAKPDLPAPAPAPAKPKTVPVVKKAAPPVKAAVPSKQPAPSPQAIAVAAAPPSAEPPAAAEPSAPQAPAAPTAPAPPKTVTGVEYIQAPQPDYPPAAKRMGEEGKVVLRVLVNERGRPERADVQRSSGSSRLDEAARAAAMRAVFRPHMEDGKAVAVYALVPINFSIQ